MNRGVQRDSYRSGLVQRSMKPATMQAHHGQFHRTRDKPIPIRSSSVFCKHEDDDADENDEGGDEDDDDHHGLASSSDPISPNTAPLPEHRNARTGPDPR